MPKRKKVIMPFIAALGLFILIIDTRGAVAGAQEGINLCIKTLIPSLFPFFVISGYFCRVCSEMELPFLKPLSWLCGVPKGAESLLVIGMLGGYPVGAKAITDAWRERQIETDDAKRLLGFCSNAGPSFVFGIIGGMFENLLTAWSLLAILILSAIITGWLLPRKKYTRSVDTRRPKASFSKIFDGSLKAIASVCGWVILFRVAISILERWVLWFLPDSARIILTGILELSNGCIALSGIQNHGFRFILGAGMLSFGGLCVYLQTVSVTEELGVGFYFPGKILQCLISFTLAGFAQFALFPADQTIPLRIITIPAFILCLFITAIKLHFGKKTVAISRFSMYNTGNQL